MRARVILLGWEGGGMTAKMDTKLITLVGGEHKLTTAEMMDSRMLERPSPSLLDAKLFNELVLTLNGTDLLLPLLRRRDFNGPGPLD